MTLIFYLVLIAPLVVLFSVGYYPLVLFWRLLTKRELFGLPDVYAPFAGAFGTALAFLSFGLLGLDRFALVSKHVTTVWESSGYNCEMAQGLFSGGLCAVMLVIVTTVSPRFARTPKITTPAVAILASFLAFSFWPVLFSPFV